MKKTRSKLRNRTNLMVAAGAAVGALGIFSSQAHAQVSYVTAGSTYSQNFDNLYVTVPANNITVAASTLPLGWGFVEAGANANTTLRNDNGSSGTGDTFLYGATSSNERAFGSYASGSLTSQFGLQLTNTSGGTLNSFTLSYTGEQWKDGGSATAVLNSLAFAYGLGATSLTAGTYTNVTQLNFQAVKNNLTADATLDGNLAANQLAISFTVTGISWTSGQSLFLRWTDINDPGNDDGLAIDNLSFSAVAASINAKWNTTNGAWTIGSGVNWTGATGTVYTEGDNVTFDNTGGVGGTITLNTNVSPSAVNVSATTGTYSFTGTGSINGSGSLTKTNAGTLDLTGLSNGNGYTGGTNINGGTVIVSNDNQLGAASGAINFGGGELRTATSGITSARAIVVGAAGGTFNSNGLSSSTSGTTGINGQFTKSGNGNLALNGAVTFNSAGLLNITGGSVTLGQASGTVTQTSGGTYGGNLVVANPIRVNFDGGTFSGAGQIQVQTTGTLISNSNGGTVAGGTVNVNVALNSNNTAFTAGDVTAGTYTAGTFVTTLGGTTGAVNSVLTVGGIISGNSDLNIGNNSTTGGGSGGLLLNAANTYTGTTTINAANATIKLGVDNALPTTTNVIVGTQTGVNAPVLDLNGRNQTIASLSDGANVSVSKFLTIKNNAGVDSILTVSGSLTPSGTFGGVIADGTTNKIALVKAGSNTLKLTGQSTYTGGTTITGGTIDIGTSGSHLASTGAVEVNGGTFDLGAFDETVGSVKLTSGSIVSSGGKLTGTGYDVRSGSITAKLGGGATVALTKSTSGTVALQGAGTYDGGTNVNAGTLQVGTAASLGTGAVVVQLGAVLELANLTAGGLSGELSTAIDNAALLNVQGTTDLANGVNEFVGQLALGGTTFQFTGVAQTFGAIGNSGVDVQSSFLSGNGQITLVPEPTSMGLIGLGAAALLGRRRRKLA